MLRTRNSTSTMTTAATINPTQSPALKTPPMAAQPVAVVLKRMSTARSVTRESANGRVEGRGVKPCDSIIGAALTDLAPEWVAPDQTEESRDGGVVHDDERVGHTSDSLDNPGHMAFPVPLLSPAVTHDEHSATAEEDER